MNKAKIAAITSIVGLAGATTVAFLESLRQRGRAIEAEACATLLVLGALDEGELYEICPACDGVGQGCSYCFDQRVIRHEHDE